jgi:hypothetical protein
MVCLCRPSLFDLRCRRGPRQILLRSNSPAPINPPERQSSWNKRLHDLRWRRLANEMLYQTNLRFGLRLPLNHNLLHLHRPQSFPHADGGLSIPANRVPAYVILAYISVHRVRIEGGLRVRVARAHRCRPIRQPDIHLGDLHGWINDLALRWRQQRLRIGQNGGRRRVRRDGSRMLNRWGRLLACWSSLLNHWHCRLRRLGRWFDRRDRGLNRWARLLDR